MEQGTQKVEVVNVEISAVTIGASGLSTVEPIGGGIFNDAGTLSVTDAAIVANVALNGCGIYNSGTLTVTDSTISGNSFGSGTR